MDECKKCVRGYIFYIFFFIMVSVVFCSMGIYYYVSFKEHEGATNVCVQIHKEGYEVLGNFQTVDNFGRLKFHSVVKYKDGCINEIEVPAAEYFLEVNNE